MSRSQSAEILNGTSVVEYRTVKVSSTYLKLVACAWEKVFAFCEISDKNSFGTCVECDPTSVVPTFETSLQEARQ